MIRVGMRIAFDGGYGRKVAIGIGAYPQTHDWVIELLDPDPSSAFSSAAAAVGRFDGLIVQTNTRAWARDAARQDIPVVNVGPVWPGVALPRVGVDNVEVGELAARHLWDLGSEHFAFVGQRPFSFSRERLTGFHRELQRTGHRCRVCPVRISSNETQLAEWFARLRRPVGICGSSHSWGYRTLCACRLARPSRAGGSGRHRSRQRRTDLSMKEIAARAGYATAQHMANMFRMSENRSPLAFRRQSSQP